MKISKIEIAWFRGAAEKSVLNTDGKSVVVYGSNGSGKSSFVDSMEFAICGKLTHLSHEYSGKKQERGLINTHLPKDGSTRVDIVFDGTAKREIHVSKDGSVRSTGTESPPLSDWDYRRTVLRQDEVATFVKDTKGDKYAALLPLLGLEELEQAAANLRALRRAIEDRGRMKELAGRLSITRDVRRKTFLSKSDEQIEKDLRVKAGRLGLEAGDTLTVSALVKQAKELLDSQVAALDQSTRAHVVLTQLASAPIRERLQEVRERTTTFVSKAEPLLDERLAILGATARYATALDEPGLIDCPSCGRAIPAPDFRYHVSLETDRLAEIAALRDARDGAINALCDSIQEAKTLTFRSEVSGWRDLDLARSAARDWLQKLDVNALRGGCAPGDVDDVESNVVPLIESAAGVSKEAPEDAKALADTKGQFTSAEIALSVRVDERSLADAQLLIRYVETLEAEIRRQIAAKASKAVAEVSVSVREMWRVLHPTRPIDQIEVYLPGDADKAIDVRLQFHGVSQESPRLTLSEGFRNSLGLCLFLAMAERDDGQARPLILDDVVVSLDREHRGLLMEVITTRFPNRQVLLFTHDRDWFVDLKQLLPESGWKFMTLLPYEAPELGIRWAVTSGGFEEAKALLPTRPDAAGNDARKVMDVELALIADRLKLRLPYRRGEKNDMRHSPELLEAIIGSGKRCFEVREGEKHVAASEQLKRLDEARRHLIAWGNRASHTFDLVRPEAEKLIRVCEEAMAVFRCADCEKKLWFADAAAKQVQCQCSGIRWRYGKD